MTRNARLHQRPPRHSPTENASRSADTINVSNGDQRRNTKETCIVRGVCPLNGAIRNTGVKTIASTATAKTKTASQTSLRLALGQLQNRVRTSGMVCSISSLYLADHRDGPQRADGQKRHQVNQQVPAAVARRSRFNVLDSFSTSVRALQSHAHAPELLRVEVNLRAVLDLALQVLTFRRVENLCQPAAQWLHADLNAQIRRRLRRVHDHKEQRFTNVRIRPHRNDVRIDFPIDKERKRRPFVSAYSVCKK